MHWQNPCCAFPVVWTLKNKHVIRLLCFFTKIKTVFSEKWNINQFYLNRELKKCLSYMLFIVDWNIYFIHNGILCFKHHVIFKKFVMDVLYYIILLYVISKCDKSLQVCNCRVRKETKSSKPSDNGARKEITMVTDSVPIASEKTPMFVRSLSLSNL